ncbi:unnamed protein product [Trichogramma brassicae]|uniref:Uncharacterized protein n=1 Tax=Trichogramma brassicae TaxID=86971 RepID=A0A6H5IY71_9HYME|nr:unnamed protein product [Trichogramma brassicae]
MINHRRVPKQVKRMILLYLHRSLSILKSVIGLTIVQSCQYNCIDKLYILYKGRMVRRMSRFLMINHRRVPKQVKKNDIGIFTQEPIYTKKVIGKEGVHLSAQHIRSFIFKKTIRTFSYFSNSMSLIRAKSYRSKIYMQRMWPKNSRKHFLAIVTEAKRQRRGAGRVTSAGTRICNYKI